MNTIPVEELRRLKTQLENGELSEKEFQAEKRRLLGLGDIHNEEDSERVDVASDSDEFKETANQSDKEIRRSSKERSNGGQVRKGKYDYNRWVMELRDGRYYFSKRIIDKVEPLLTPNYVTVSTEYESLANRIMDDFDHYGVEQYSIRQILYWHCTTIDLMSIMNVKSLRRLLITTFLDDNDWTLSAPESNTRSWRKYFGEPTKRKDEIEAWLSHCTGMQLCAVYCLCKAYGSINLAYALARIVENEKEPNWSTSFGEIYQLVNQKTFRIYLAQSLVFSNFAFYYGIHFKENGPIIK